MFGVLAGDTYGSYVFSGIMEHSTDRLWIGIRGKGSHLVNPDGTRIRINTSSKTVFDESARIYSMLPTYSEEAATYLTNLVANYHTEQPFSEAMALTAIAHGEADIVAEISRKRCLEQRAATSLIMEAGGVMIDQYGESIAGQRHSEWGKKPELLVTAANMDLALDFLNKLHLLKIRS
jgi:fructose-1,6-bisphosphatase/inositol monophosphatase family enzyme